MFKRWVKWSWVCFYWTRLNWCERVRAIKTNRMLFSHSKSSTTVFFINVLLPVVTNSWHKPNKELSWWPTKRSCDIHSITKAPEIRFSELFNPLCTTGHQLFWCFRPFRFNKSQRAEELQRRCKHRLTCRKLTRRWWKPAEELLNLAGGQRAGSSYVDDVAAAGGERQKAS